MPREHVSDGCSPLNAPAPNLRALIQTPPKSHNPCAGVLGKFLSEPVRTYSAGMRARLNFALSFAVDFDCYLIDEVIAVGDTRFQQRSHEELFEKRADRSLILASHVPTMVKSYCSRAV